MAALRIVWILLWFSAAAMVGLTFVWPALAPESQANAVYQFVAIAAFWTFFAALAALIWQKACKAPRT